MTHQDTQTAYGAWSILNHWIVAFFVVILLTLGLTLEFVPKSKAAHSLLHLHMSISLLAMPFIFLRIIWRLKHGFPNTLSHHAPYESKLARGVQVALLIALPVQILTGIMCIWTTGRSIDFFHLVQISSPLSIKNHEAHEFFEALHVYGANPILLILIGLHFVGFLKSIFGSAPSSLADLNHHKK